jgi:hypothetical protein
MLTRNNPIRIKRRPKGILIPVDEYDSRKPLYEDKDFKYIGAWNGQAGMQKLLRKRGVICGGSVDLGISHGIGYTRLERFCKMLAKTYGPRSICTSLYYLYDRTIHEFSKHRNDLTGCGDYPKLLGEYLHVGGRQNPSETS